MARNWLIPLRLAADAGMLCVFSAAYIVALDFPFRSARYPLVVCAIGICLAAANLIRDAVEACRRPEAGHLSNPSQSVRALGMSIALLMLVASVAAFGMLAGTAIWLPLMLRFAAGIRWPVALLDGVLVVVFLFLLEHVGLGSLPSGLLL